MRSCYDGVLFALTLGALTTGCALTESASDFVQSLGEAQDEQAAGGEAEPAGEVAEASTAKAYVSAEEREARSSVGLGGTVAELVGDPPTVAAEPKTPAEELEVLTEIKLELDDAKWSYPARPEALAFTVEGSFTLQAEPVYADLVYYAKVSCQVAPGDVRSSVVDLRGKGGRRRYYGGAPTVPVGDPQAFTSVVSWGDEPLGHYPCEIKFHATTESIKKPFAVRGTWCTDGETLSEGGCTFAPDPSPEAAGSARDWKLAPDRRTITVTVDLPKRVLTDRRLYLRRSCDEGDHRSVRIGWTHNEMASFLAAGDSTRVTFYNYEPWFTEEKPCELTLEWWRENRDGTRGEPEELAHACMPAFVIVPGRCDGFVSPDQSSPGSGPMTVTKFEPNIVTDRSRYTQITVEVEVAAHSSIAGKHQLLIRSNCPSRRHGPTLHFGSTGSQTPIEMLRSGEIHTATYTSWLGREKLRGVCSLSAEMVAVGAKTGKVLATACVNRKGATDCPAKTE